MQKLLHICAIFLVTGLVGCVSPMQTPEENKINGDLLQKQISQLDKSKMLDITTSKIENASDKSLLKTKGIYLGIALDGASPAFEGDIKRVEELLFSKITTGPSLILSNYTANAHIYPRADLITIPIAAKAVGDFVLNKPVKQPTLAVVNISAHGKTNLLHKRVGTYREQSQLTGEYLQKILLDVDSSNTTPMLLIISACYSGSLIPILSAPNRIIITASASDRNSFGCGSTSKNTVFTQFLLDKEINVNLSLYEFFAAALKRITDHENEKKYTNSLPQIFIGEKMQKLYQAPINKWHEVLTLQ